MAALYDNRKELILHTGREMAEVCIMFEHVREIYCTGKFRSYG
jgi:hypothetical protein